MHVRVNLIWRDRDDEFTWKGPHCMLSPGYKSILTALAYDKHFDLSNWVGKERKRINKIKKTN